MLFTNVLPEAIYCCLQTCNVYGVLLTLWCIYYVQTGDKLIHAYAPTSKSHDTHGIPDSLSISIVYSSIV